MNRIPTLRSKTTPLAAAILTGAILSIPTLHAQEFIWDNITGNWDEPTNWAGGTEPSNFESDGILKFGGDGETGYISTNDLLPDTNGHFTFHRLVLDSTATVTNTLNTTGAGLLKFVSSAGDSGAIVQEGTGAFQINMPIFVDEPLLLAGAANAGRVTFGRAITGTGAITIDDGDWKFSGANSAWSGTTTISGGATVLVQPTAGTPGTAVNLSLSGANSLFGTSGTIAINDGTLKLSPIESGNITLGNNRALAFGALGGVVDIVNTIGGHIAGGDFAVTTTAGATEPGVIKFNGGANGLMENSVTNGNWDVGKNALRFRSMTGEGPLRLELSNGAATRLGAGGAATIATALTIRGVQGGNPTSADAQRNSAIARDMGRVVLDGFSSVTYTNGLVLENALQFHAANGARGLDGNVTIAGTASGNPGFVAFSGRGTGTNLGPTINAPGANGVGQNVLWLGRDNNDTLTIQDGGTAVLDSRMRYDQKNHHGVLLNANAAIEGGGTLRFYQSLSNASGNVEANRQGQSGVNLVANVGNHIVQGDLIGTGNSTRDAAVDLYLPVGAPITAEVTGDTSQRPYGGVIFDNTSDLVVNGSGFGGLRINGFARANALFANSAPDTVSNVDKVNNLLTPARIGALTGSGGYLTVAPANETYVFPNAEWAPGVAVGLKVVNQNPNGADLRFDAAKTSWGHNLAIDAGATFDTGAAGFTLTAGTLHGTGNVTGTGGLTIDTGASIAPGLNGVGTLSVRNLTIGGTFLGDASGATNDLVHVPGDLTLGVGSSFSLASGTPAANRTTFLTYTGELTGSFGSIAGAPVGATVNYDIPGRVRLVLDTINERVWEGNPAAVWSTSGADANWKGLAAFANGDQVVFNDTAAGSKTVTINGVVQPDLVTVDTAGSYVIQGTAANYIGGEAAFLKEGTGSVTLSGNNTYGSGTTLSDGTLLLGNDNALPDAGSVIVREAATLNLGGHADTIGELTVAGAILNGTLTAGPVTLENEADIAANLILAGNLTKTEAGTATIGGNVDLGAANRTLAVNSGVLAIDGVVSNGTLTKNGTGVLELGGTNTHSGGTNVVAGTLRATAAQAFGTGALAVSAGATANLDGFDQSAGALSGAGSITLGEATLTLNGTTNSTFSGVISGPGDLAKAGTGVLTLSSANTFAGGLNVQGGRVNLANASAAGTGLITVGTGGAIQVGGAHTNNVQLDGGIVSSQSGANLGGIWTVNGDTEFRTYNQDTNGGSDIILTGTLSGTGDISLVASPTTASADVGQGLRFRGATVSDYTGTIIAGKKTKLEIQIASATGTNPIGDGTIRMVAGTSTGGLNGDYSQLQPRTNTADQTHILGTDVEISGEGYVNVNILGAANTVAQFGELSIGAGQILGASKNDKDVRKLEFTSVNLTGGMAEVRAFDPAFGSQTNDNRGGSDIRLGDIGEAEAGAGLITQSGGTNVVEIFGEATYTGPTHIDAGTLRVSVGGSIESSSEVRIATGATLDVLAHVEGYNIPAGQTLTGAGGWDGDIIFSGILAPGSGVGSISGDNFTLEGTAALQFELAASDLSDRLVLTGAFDKGSAGAFQFDFGGTGAEGLYTLVQFASTTFSAADFSATGLAPGLTGTFQMTDTALQLAVVPEPGSAIALALGGALLGMRRRRRA